MAKELTFTRVRDGIIMALHKAYPTAPVFSYTEDQDVTDGSFNVVFVNARGREKLGNFRTHLATFDVIYYADRNNVTDDILRVSTDLPLLLETITAPSGAKAHPEGEIQPTKQDDDTLHCVVTYAYGVMAKRVTIEDGQELYDYDLMRRLILHLPAEVEDNG